MLYNDFPYSFAFIKSSGLQPGKENLLVPSALSVHITHHDKKFYANIPLSTHLWKYHIIFVPEKVITEICLKLIFQIIQT